MREAAARPGSYPCVRHGSKRSQIASEQEVVAAAEFTYRVTQAQGDRTGNAREVQRRRGVWLCGELIARRAGALRPVRVGKARADLEEAR
jgi:hypothetical protein